MAQNAISEIARHRQAKFRHGGIQEYSEPAVEASKADKGFYLPIFHDNLTKHLRSLVVSTDGSTDAERAGKACRKGKSCFIQLLKDSTFSDLTVFVGKEKQVFHLHRNIVCLGSEFFNKACKSQFKEGCSREITFPEITPDAFRHVVVWLYHGGFETELYDREILGAYDAAEYLQVSTFQIAVIESFASFCKEKGPTLDSEAKQKTFIFFLHLCEISHVSHIYRLTKCAESFLTHFQFGAEYLISLLNDGQLNNIFIAAMINAGQDLRSISSCVRCPCGDKESRLGCRGRDLRLRMSGEELEKLENRNVGQGWNQKLLVNE